MSLIIAGAGLAGLLAGNMLKHRSPMIVEKQSELPNNHSAVLRFRSSIVGDTLGIPFRKVQMIKCAAPWRNPVANALSYSFKNTGSYRSDRSITSGLVSEERYIAPSDLISRMAVYLEMQYDAEVVFGDKGPYISTIPMPALMKLLDYPGQDAISFEYRQGYNIKATIANCDAYVSLMIPDNMSAITRISITGNELIVEVPEHLIYGALKQDTACHLAATAAGLVGIHKPFLSDIQFSKMQYQKILPIAEEARRDFLYWATDRHNIFSLGRFATWRPGLLLDDLVKDIRLIDGWLDRKDRYAIAQRR